MLVENRGDAERVSARGSVVRALADQHQGEVRLRPDEDDRPRARSSSAVRPALTPARVIGSGTPLSYETVNVSGVAGEPLLSGATVTVRFTTPMPES